MSRPIIVATVIAGTLDLLSAFVFAGMAGMSAGGVLQFVASGPFGDAMLQSPAGYPLGILVHVGIMSVMAAVYISVARRTPALLRHPIVNGLLYGLLLWIVMYWIVRPLRWPDFWPLSAYAGKTVAELVWSIGNALFSHCILVGIPIALVAARYFKRRSGFAR